MDDHKSLYDLAKDSPEALVEMTAAEFSSIVRGAIHHGFMAGFPLGVAVSLVSVVLMLLLLRSF